MRRSRFAQRIQTPACARRPNSPARSEWYPARSSRLNWQGERAVVVARDGIAIIVNRANTINAIMRSQIAEVFSGQVSVWPTGPNAGKVIAVVSREAGSGTRDAFEAMAMNGARVTLTAVVMPGEAAMVDYVAQHPEAIGYCAMSFLSDGVQAMTVDDIPLSPQTVENQKYPFVRTLAFIIPLSPEPAVQDFVDFALGSDGQRIIGQKNGRATVKRQDHRGPEP